MEKLTPLFISIFILVWLAALSHLILRHRCRAVEQRDDK